MKPLPGFISLGRLFLYSVLLLHLFSFSIHGNEIQCKAESENPRELATHCSDLTKSLRAHPHASERDVWGKFCRSKDFTTPLEWRTDYCVITLCTTDFADYRKNDIFSIDDDVVPMVQAVIHECFLEGRYGGGIGDVGRRKIFSIQLFDAALPAQGTISLAWNTLNASEAGPA